MLMRTIISSITYHVNRFNRLYKKFFTPAQYLRALPLDIGIIVGYNKVVRLLKW